jgi:hypothetical protein
VLGEVGEPAREWAALEPVEHRQRRFGIAVEPQVQACLRHVRQQLVDDRAAGPGAPAPAHDGRERLVTPAGVDQDVRADHSVERGSRQAARPHLLVELDRLLRATGRRQRGDQPRLRPGGDPPDSLLRQELGQPAVAVVDRQHERVERPAGQRRP